MEAAPFASFDLGSFDLGSTNSSQASLRSQVIYSVVSVAMASCLDNIVEPAVEPAHHGRSESPIKHSADTRNLLLGMCCCPPAPEIVYLADECANLVRAGGTLL